MPADLGRVQKVWIERIRESGGVVSVKSVQSVEAWIPMPDSDDIRVPLRMVESLVERGVLVKNDQGDYRLVTS